MQNNNIDVCRLCLKLVRGANLAVINEVMREMLRLLLIKLDLDVSEHPLVCRTCSKVLDEINLFKSKCLCTEDMIRAHIETNSKISLRDLLIEMENKGNIYVGEDEMVCRLCIKLPLNGNYIALGETGDGISFIKDMMQIHLPEMDLSISEKPIICEVCHVQLKNYASFATNCMDVEEKIKLYCDLQKISGPVDLASVLQFMEYKALDLQNSLDKDLVIKQEDDLVIVKVEKIQDVEDYILEDRLDISSASELYLKNEEIEIKSENDEMSEEMEDSVPTLAPDNSGKSCSLKGQGQIRKSQMHKCAICEFETRHKNNLNQHIMLKHRDRRAQRKFKCDKCSYETDLRCNLRMHNLRHKDKSEVEMYKCANCEFEAMRKDSLNRHMLTHRDPRAERKYKCDRCPYDTDNKSSLGTHNLIHKDKSEVEIHKCVRCEYETKRKSNLKNHMMKHRDPKAEKEFKCDRCSFETNYKGSLRKHNLMHKDKSEVQASAISRT